MRDRTNISDALENHEENKNKDLSSTICEFVSLECTPQVRYNYSIVCLDFSPGVGAFLTLLIDLSFPTLGNLIKKF